MPIALYVIGKTNLEGVAPLTQRYLTMVRRFVGMEYVEIPDLKKVSHMPVKTRVQKEASLFESYLKPSDTLILLDEKGSLFSSVALSDKMNGWMLHCPGRLVFLIGGAYGFCDTLKQKAHSTLSLSKLTFNHQMVRALFCEQLYRSFTLIKGLPYHNE